MYKYVSFPSCSQSAESEGVPRAFISFLLVTTVLFTAYEAFFDQSISNKSLEVIGLMSVVATLEFLQVAAINALDDN